MNTELLNRINMNDVYVKEFINNATDEQMEFFDIAAKLLSNNNDMVRRTFLIKLMISKKNGISFIQAQTKLNPQYMRIILPAQKN